MIIKDLIGPTDPEKEARIKRATQDFAYFCQYYLKEAFPIPFAEYQKIIIDIINKQAITEVDVKSLKKFIKKDRHIYLKVSEKLEGILDLEPRDHGKTTRMSQALPLWLVLTRAGVFPVVVGVSRESATNFIESIKLELENNDRILEDFGDLKGRTWKKNKITLKNDNAIAAVGANEGIRGIKDKYRRPTHIICDDLLKDKDVESRSLRESLFRWFKRVIMNLGKGALIIVVNTIMHPDDLPSRLLKEIKGSKLKNWVGFRFSATTPEGKPLWPQRWSLRDLAKKKEELGVSIYATEWENEPIAEEEKKFKKEWFRYFELEDVNLRNLVKVMAVDPATGKETGDYSAIVVVGLSDSGILYVLDAEGAKISDLRLIDRIITKYKLWWPGKIIFEIQTFQEIYKNQLLREALKQNVILPVIGVKQTSNKKFRISKLSPLIEAGIVLFRKEQTLLLTQLENFPKDHDDLPDALEMAVSALISAGSGPVEYETVARRRYRNKRGGIW